jgi:hypothetical protein
MARFQVKGLVTVEIEIMVHADNQSEAAKLIEDRILMTAGVADTEPDEFEVREDSIYDVTIHSVNKE